MLGTVEAECTDEHCTDHQCGNKSCAGCNHDTQEADLSNYSSVALSSLFALNELDMEKLSIFTKEIIFVTGLNSGDDKETQESKTVSLKMDELLEGFNSEDKIKWSADEEASVKDYLKKYFVDNQFLNSRITYEGEFNRIELPDGLITKDHTLVDFYLEDKNLGTIMLLSKNDDLYFLSAIIIYNVQP